MIDMSTTTELMLMHAKIARVISTGRDETCCATDPAVADWLDRQGHMIKIRRPWPLVYLLYAPGER